MLPIRSFHTICDKCRLSLEDGDEYNCNYWLHKKEKYGNANLIRNYCKICVKEFPLYDGRKDFLCEVCQRYVPIFNKFPKFLEICQLYDFLIVDENTEASKVFNVMKDFDEIIKYLEENY